VSRFEVVAIGASLGGLSAIETLLEALPKTFPAAVVIVQHRRADGDSRLLELLRGHSVLPVSEPEDKQPLQPGNVYLAPPNYHMLVERGLLSLSIDPPVAFARPSMDVLFESVADAYGPRAVAVVLTGSNRDGAAGAAAIKRHGGVVLVQDPSSAEAPETPNAAIAATRVDAVLGLPALALHLSAITSEP
jgi:two-component system, chemotaxis family, protein-glutamate methylesterase/glutaminase